MAEKKVSIRLGIVGGQEVTATFDQVGKKGEDSLDRIGNAASRSGQRVEAASRQFRGSMQNVSYQVQDVAVQMAAGTAASTALAQQLPQLLSGFGLMGAIMGTVAAIAIPLAAHFLLMGKNAKEAAKDVEDLAKNVKELAAANDNFSVDGINALIEKYGELDTKILLMIAHQRELAGDKAMEAARAAVAGVADQFGDLIDVVDLFDNYMAGGKSDPMMLIQAEETAKSLQETFGLTIDQARDLIAAVNDARGAETFEEMADASARLTELLGENKFATIELRDMLQSAEEQTRALNKEGSQSGAWLGFAVGMAGTLAQRLWDAAKGAAAVRGAVAAKASPAAQLAAQYSLYGGAQTSIRDRMNENSTLYGGDGTGLSEADRKGLYPKAPGGGGGGETDAQKDRKKMEQEAKAIYDSTRTAAEKYADEIKRLDELKAAGLVTGDTYNRQVDALRDKFDQQGTILEAIQQKMKDYATEATHSFGKIGDAITGAFDAGADALGDFVRNGKVDFHSLISGIMGDLASLAAKQWITGPLAQILSGMGGGGGTATGGAGGGGFWGKLLGGLLGGITGKAPATVSHEGGMAGSGMAREVSAALMAGARRYHSGGLAGDEVLSVLQKGERVLNRRQTRAYDRGESGRPMQVNFNVRDGQSLRQSRTQVAADMGRALAMGQRAR